jgi:hypothetical protein
MASDDFLTGLGNTLVDIARPLERAVQSPDAFGALLIRHGWQPPTGSAYLTKVRDHLGVVQNIDAAVKILVELAQSEGVPLERAQAALAASVKVGKDVQALAQLPPPAGMLAPLDTSAFWQEFPLELVQTLIADYLEVQRPLLYAPLHLLGIVEREPEPAGGRPGRLDYVRNELRWDRLPRLFTDPTGLAAEIYGWGGNLNHDKLLGRLERTVLALGLPAARRIPTPTLAAAYYDAGSQHLATVRELRFPLLADRSLQYGHYEIGVVVLPVPSEAQKAAPPNGLVIGPYVAGAATATVPLYGSLALNLRGGLVSDAPVGVEVRPDGVGARLDPGTTSFEAGIELAAAPPQPWRLLGGPASHRVELADAAIELAVAGSATDPELMFTVRTSKLELIVDLAEGDGFLNQILGTEPQSFALGGALMWSSKRGLGFDGRAGLRLLLPINKKLGPVELRSILVALEAVSGKPLTVAVAVTGSARLGPVAASVESIGVAARLTPRPPQHGPGMLGQLDLAFDFKPPDGAGLAIDAGPVVGGGFLSFDRTQEQYAGLVQLQFAGISLRAIGLLTTRMPDGSKGFSLLVVIAADIPPIQLGFGFALTGVGGLLGVNRTMALEVLRQGLRAGTLGSVLFPKDPVRNAPQLVSDLRAVFPPAPDRHVFGPMAAIVWGTPPIIKAELGVLLELPAPIRLAILGRLTMALPTEKAAVVLLRLDVLGTLEPDRGLLAIDASLIDSHVAGFPVTGDMAMRLRWLQQPTFALAVGGFHPRFQPPPGFPALRRLAISLSQGDNPRLRLEAYLALTSNTAQVGARLELYAAAKTFLGTFSVEGHLGFDVLFQFEPFYLDAEISAGLALRRDGSVLFEVDLNFRLTGPTPWHARGRASFKILFAKLSVSFDARIGDAPPPPALPSPDPLSPLRQALSERSSWSAQPPGQGAVVSLRKTEEAAVAVMLHPLGELTVRQRVLPLARSISRFGSARLDRPRRYDLTIQGLPATAPEQVTDQFAPAQFDDLTDDQKLSAPPFVEAKAGVRVRASGEGFPKGLLGVPFSYETVLIDELDPERPLAPPRSRPDAPYVLQDTTFARLWSQGAAARAATRGTGEEKFSAPARTVRLKPSRYALAGADDLKPAAANGKATGLDFTEASAVAERDEQLEVVHEFELVS